MQITNTCICFLIKSGFIHKFHNKSQTLAFMLSHKEWVHSQIPQQITNTCIHVFSQRVASFTNSTTNYKHLHSCFLIKSSFIHKFHNKSQTLAFMFSHKQQLHSQTPQQVNAMPVNDGTSHCVWTFKGTYLQCQPHRAKI